MSRDFVAWTPPAEPDDGARGEAGENPARRADEACVSDDLAHRSEAAPVAFRGARRLDPATKVATKPSANASTATAAISARRTRTFAGALRRCA
ncbi:MAG TPA: hypothetical protein VHF67_10140 [Gaiellaceae bacterium]|nr:hypothetical protein [Gaiellaceae bacterium]